MSLWYDSPGPEHFATKYAGQTMAWCGYDSQELFEKNIQDPSKKEKLEESGWLDTPIEYRFNSQGFRCEEFDDRPAGIALGCSITAGVALDAYDTWPSLLSRKLNTHIWNLGVPSGAMTTCFRMLDHYIDVLKPKFVVLLAPSKFRFEFMMADQQHCIFMPNGLQHQEKFAREWFFNDANSDLDSRKNMLAMQQICSTRSVPFYSWPSDGELFKQATRRNILLRGPQRIIARDLLHPGGEKHRILSDLMYKELTQAPG